MAKVDFTAAANAAAVAAAAAAIQGAAPGAMAPAVVTLRDRVNAFNTSVKNANANSDLTFANLVNATVDGFNVALERTVLAFVDERNLEGAAGVLEMLGSLTPILGVFGGPAGGLAGGLLSAALGVVSAILRAFQPQAKSLNVEIKEMLQHLHAQLVHDELTAALGDLERATGPMHMVHDGSRTWEQMQSGWINMFEGNAAHQLNLTKSWLEKAGNQDNAEWELIFEGYWHVTTLRMQVLAQTCAKLKVDGEAEQIGRVTLDERKTRDREFSRELRQVAINRGNLLHVGDNRGLWERSTLVSEADYKQLRSGVDEAFVGSISRRIFALDRNEGKVFQRVDAATNHWQDLMAVAGGARSMTVLSEPSAEANGRAAERVVVLNKAGDTLHSKISVGTAKHKVGDTRLSEKNIRQFVAAEAFTAVAGASRPGGAGQASRPSTHYFALGQRGQVFVGLRQEAGKSPLGESLQLSKLVDLNQELKGLAVGRDGSDNEDQLIAYSENEVRVRRLVPRYPWTSTTPGGMPVDQASNWAPLVLPPSMKGKKITSVAGSLTGQILVLIERKLWVYRPAARTPGNSWTWEWKGNSRGDMDFVYHDPIPGYSLYSEYL